MSFVDAVACLPYQKMSNNYRFGTISLNLALDLILDDESRKIVCQAYFLREVYVNVYKTLMKAQYYFNNDRFLQNTVKFIFNHIKESSFDLNLMLGLDKNNSIYMIFRFFIIVVMKDPKVLDLHYKVIINNCAKIWNRLFQANVMNILKIDFQRLKAEIENYPLFFMYCDLSVDENKIIEEEQFARVNLSIAIFEFNIRQEEMMVREDIYKKAKDKPSLQKKQIQIIENEAASLLQIIKNEEARLFFLTCQIFSVLKKEIKAREKVYLFAENALKKINLYWENILLLNEENKQRQIICYEKNLSLEKLFLSYEEFKRAYLIELQNRRQIIMQEDFERSIVLSYESSLRIMLINLKILLMQKNSERNNIYYNIIKVFNESEEDIHRMMILDEENKAFIVFNESEGICRMMILDEENKKVPMYLKFGQPGFNFCDGYSLDVIRKRVISNQLQLIVIKEKVRHIELVKEDLDMGEEIALRLRWQIEKIDQMQISNFDQKQIHELQCQVQQNKVMLDLLDLQFESIKRLETCKKHLLQVQKEIENEMQVMRTRKEQMMRLQ